MMLSFHTPLTRMKVVTNGPFFYAPGYYTLGCQANAKLENSIITSNCHSLPPN